MKGPGGPGGAPKKPKVLVEKQIRKKETPQKNDLPTPASAAKWVNPYTFTAGPQEEKHLEVPPGLEKKTSDPYAEWSDAERMAEYTETGNPQYLTPKLALDMDVGQEIMRQVPGATDAHIFASKSEEDFRAEEKEYTNQILTKYAADSKSLDGLPFGEQVQRMLAVAGLRVTGGGLELHELESARNTAMDMLRTMLVEREDGVHELFGALRYADSAGQRDLWVVESLYKMTHDDFVLLSHTPADELTDAERERGRGCARALNEFVEVGRAFIGGEFAPETKYLFAERARALACEIGGLSEQTDFEKQEPFEITKGRYAVFTHDGNRIYIADQETTKDVVDLLRNAPPVWREETGQYFARFHREHVPQEVWEAVDMVMDAGIPLDRVVGEFGMQDKELIHDYVAMASIMTTPGMTAFWGK